MYVCDSVYEINNALLLKPITFPVKFLWRFQIQGLFSNLSLNLILYNKLEKKYKVNIN